MIHRRKVLGMAAASLTMGAAPKPDARMLSLSDPRFAAVGDGQADDTIAVERWLDELGRTGLTGWLPQGRYRVPGLGARRISTPLKVVGAGPSASVLHAEDQAPANWLNLDAPAVLSGVGFQNFKNVIVISDGDPLLYGRSGPDSFPQTLSRDLDGLEIRQCHFEDCRRPLIAFGAGKFRIHDVRIEGNVVRRAWAGFYLDIPRLSDVFVKDNVIADIDGSAAGYSRRGNPIRGGSSRAIHLSHDRSTYQEETGRFHISGNKISGIRDRRSLGPEESPEVNAINVTGCRNVEIFNNEISDVSSAVADNCEGIYCKALDVRIENNRLVNTGGTEAFIILKGIVPGLAMSGIQYARAKNISVKGNDLINDRDGAAGIVSHVSGTRCLGNRLKGFRRGSSTSAALYVYAAHRVDDVEIADNEVSDSSCDAAIAIKAAGRNYQVRRNIIRGVYGRPSGAGGVAGIAVLNGNGAQPLQDLEISDNVISDVGSEGGKVGAAYQLGSGNGVVSAVRIARNQLSNVDQIARLAGEIRADLSSDRCRDRRGGQLFPDSVLLLVDGRAYASFRLGTLALAPRRKTRVAWPAELEYRQGATLRMAVAIAGVSCLAASRGGVVTLDILNRGSRMVQVSPEGVDISPSSSVGAGALS